MAQTIKFKSFSFRKIPLFPQGTSNSEIFGRYVAIVDVRDLPNNFPTDTNPREVKAGGRVFNKIKESLVENEHFHLLNRGLVLSVNNVQYDNQTNSLSLDFAEDRKRFGLVDGGHTYRAIQDVLKEGELEQFETRYVGLEIFTGLDDDLIVEFADARNRSAAVDDKSLKNLEGKFDFIKTALKDQLYAKQIGYKQFSESDIDIRDVIAWMTIFNVKRFPANKISEQPTMAYSAKQSCLNLFGSNTQEYESLAPILPKLLELIDYIKIRIPDIWNTKLNGRYGHKAERDRKNQHKPPHFYFMPQEKLDKLQNQSRFNGVYEVNAAHWLPIAASLRVLINYDENGMAFFSTGPKKFFDAHGEDLLRPVYEASLKQGPTYLGKDRSLWENIHKTAMLANLL